MQITHKVINHTDNIGGKRYVSVHRYITVYTIKHVSNFLII